MPKLKRRKVLETNAQSKHFEMKLECALEQRKHDGNFKLEGTTMILKTGSGGILLWQGTPPVAREASIITGAARFKWYPDDVVIVCGDVIKPLRDFVSDEMHSEIWGFSHAPHPFMVIAIAAEKNWVVDPVFAERLFNTYYSYSDELKSMDDEPTVGPFVGVDPDALRTQIAFRGRR